MKKRNYKCLICNWQGTDPKEIDVLDRFDIEHYFVCPMCFNSSLPTEALIMNLEIYTYDEQ